MKIQKMKIHNYRSICELEMTCESLVTLLGPNNHGKSNILSALEFALTTSSKPSDSDFNAFCGEDRIIWVELTFHELTEQERRTFDKYVRQDGSFCVRKSAKKNEEGKTEIEYHGYVQVPQQSWLKNSDVKGLTNREVINATPLRDFVPNTGKITLDAVRAAQSQYIDQHRGELTFIEVLETSFFLGPRNIGGGTLPEFFVIPAVRDLTDETRIKTTTMFGKLLGRTIQEMAERDPQYQRLREGIDQLVKKLNRSEGGIDERPQQMIELETRLSEELREWGVGVEIKVTPPEIERIFEIGTNITLDDGVKTLAEQKGHGLQRAVMFAMFRAWAKVLRAVPAADGTVPRTSSESLVFAIEEPELFLHPHAQRKMAQALREIAATPQHQVLVCSHSSHFIDMEQYRSICIVSKETPRVGTTVRQCTTYLFEGSANQDKKNKFHAAHWINPDRGEMFFANKVVFVEGETERVILPYLANKLNCFNHEISIIDCGSKFNLLLYTAIANAFKLNYVVIYDEDPLPITIPVDWDAEKRRQKTKTFQFNQDIIASIDTSLGRAFMIRPDFEGVAGISGNQADRKGKPLAALELFSQKNPDEIPQVIKDIVGEIYS